MNDIQSKLEDKIRRVRQVFDIDRALSQKPTSKSIAKYYRINKLAYSLFHNPQGFVHMGISRNMKYSHEDLLEQPKFIAEYIQRLDARNVLELGTGKGASSIYLAERFPNVYFGGIDLPDGQLDIARKKATKVKNFHPVEGDYHDLNQFPANHFDIVFAIESLCHSTEKEKVLGEVHRVLRKDGVFIIFDGYRGKPQASLSKTELLATQLVEKGMMVDHFEGYSQFKDTVSKAQFEIVHEEDVSQLILPAVGRFERLGERALFRHPRIGRALVKLFPSEFTFNAISGFLMPELVKMGIGRYIILVAKTIAVQDTTC